MILQKKLFFVILLIAFCSCSLELEFLEGKCNPEGDKCVKTNDCCKGLLCLDSVCEHRCLDEKCSKQNEECVIHNDCCKGGYLKCIGNICLPLGDDKCNPEGEKCKKTSDCCRGLLCLEDTCQHRCFE